MSRRPISVIALAAVLAIGGVATVARPDAPANAATAAAAKYSPALATVLAASGASDHISVMVQMAGRADLNLLTGPRAARRRELVRRLQAVQALRHPLLLAQLARWKASGEVTAYESFWIDNGIAVTATPAVIAVIVARPDVESVDLDTGRIVPAASWSAALPKYASSATTEANITATDAPTLWAQGVTGAGIVVANLDSGVDQSNPDLAGSWRGGANSWFDPYGQNATPTDFTGHGTWTMSLMVGAGSGGTNIGVAPGARWIAAKIFNNSGSASLSAIHASFQWLLDPDHNSATDDAPDVVDNSWTSASPGCSTEFEPDLQALRAASILPVFAAGNGGPAASTSLSPANLPEAFAVGGIDAGGLADSGSSRGPSSCAGVTVYPTAVAPDVNVNVADLFGLYTSATGTSFAAPEAAGVLALVLSRVPGLTADQQAAALTAGAVDLGLTGADNTYGWGRISAAASLAAAQSGCAGVTSTAFAVTPAIVSWASPALTAHAAACSGHAVTAAEWFVDVAGPPGSGTPFATSTPAFGAAAVDLVVTLPSSSVSALGPGPHAVYVDAVDETGAWGPAASGSFVIDRAGPAVSGASPSLSRTSPAATITLSASATDPANGSAAASAVAGAEWFEGADPGLGLGHALAAKDGAFNAATESLTAPVALAGWSVGTHTLLLRAVDRIGNWGAITPVTIVIDASGPAVVGATATPSNATAGTPIALAASASDPVNGDATASAIAGAEWFEGADPGVGRGYAMTASDGAFNATTESLSATIGTVGWAAGTHTVSTRAVDMVGNWGATTTVTLTLTIADGIFADGFESATTAGWSSTSGGSRLPVTAAARLVGAYGLAATLGGTSYVQDNTPTAEPSYHARFVFHPNGSQPGTGNQTIFAGLSATGQTVVAIVFHRTSAGAYQVALQAASGTSTATTAWRTITNASHTIELAWTAGSPGVASLSIDGANVASVSNLANMTVRLETARLGPSAGATSSTRGTEYFDAFASTRVTAIGLP